MNIHSELQSTDPRLALAAFAPPVPLWYPVAPWEALPPPEKPQEIADKIDDWLIDDAGCDLADYCPDSYAKEANEWQDAYANWIDQREQALGRADLARECRWRLYWADTLINMSNL